MTPKAAILDAGDTLLLSNLDIPWYLHCTEHNNVPVLIPTYDYTVIKRPLLCNCQLQGGNEFLHETLAFCHSTDKVDRNMFFYNQYGFCLSTAHEFSWRVMYASAVWFLRLSRGIGSCML